MKYHNKRTSGYASKKEAQRATELRLLAMNGNIVGLKEQVRFELIPKQLDDKGRVLERSLVYVADFAYYKDGEYVVEDTKGFRTKDYIIKRKLMLERYGIRIREL